MAVELLGRDQVVSELKLQSLNLIPLLSKSKKPAIPWKIYQTQKCSDVILPQQNIGVICGDISDGLVVMDIDIADFSMPGQILESALSRTLVIKTGSDKYHIYVKCEKLPKSVNLQNNLGRIEVKSNGTYVMGPTSIHPDTSKEYEIISNTTTIARIDFKEEIQKNLEKLEFYPDGSAKKSPQNNIAQANIKKGNRHDSALKYTNHLLFKVQLDEDVTHHEMYRWNDKLEEPLPISELDRIIQDSTKYHKNHSKEEKPDEKQLLLNFVQNKIIKTITSQNDSSKVFCLVLTNDIKHTIELGSFDATSWLAAIYHNETGKIISDDSCNVILNLLKSKAKLEKIQSETIHKRIAFVNDVLYYDLCNDSWELIRVSAQDITIVKHGDETPLFQRSSNQSKQVTPNFDGKLDSIDKMCSLLRMNSLLFKIHLVSFFVESIPTPIMAIVGQQGSIKSTQCGLIKRIVDPAGDALEDNLSHFPKGIDDLNIHFSHNFVTSFDNISGITDEQSDTLCKAVTGAGYSKRQLYTDSAEIILKFKRKIILNGITLDIERGDLAERTIQYHTSSIPKNERMTAVHVESEFRKILPDFLGCVFRVIQSSLKMSNSVSDTLTDLQRMADFEILGECISKALGNQSGVFQKEYRQSLADSDDLLNEGNPLLGFLSEIFENKDKDIRPAGDFYSTLLSYAEKNHYDVKSDNFPKSANKLRGYFTRTKPLTDDVGYTIKMYKNTSSNGFVKNITLVSVKLSPPCPLSPPLLVSSNDSGDHSGDGGDTLEKYA